MEYLGLWNYWAVIVLMMIGLYIVIAKDNLVKKIMGLTIFQVAAIMLYVSMGKIAGGTAPILPAGPGHSVIYDPATLYSNPLPHVLMLTAIVVGIATVALGLAIVVRIYEAYGTVDEAEIVAMDGEAQ